MSGLIGEVIEGIVGFFIDIWTLRRQRAQRGHATNAWGKDAADVAVFDLTVLVVSLLATVCSVVMFFALALPWWLSVVPMVAGMVWYLRRWYALVRQ